MLINGRETTLIDALDRGLCYGDGLFETLAIIDGRPQLWQQHLERMQEGCRRLDITMPAEGVLLQELSSLCQRRLQNARSSPRLVAKIILTRGKGGRGYRPTAATGSRIIALFDWPDHPLAHNDGIRVRWCRTPLGINPALAGIKHLNRLEQVMARNEWQDDNIAEGLMLDTRGRVIEGTMSNLFIVRDQRLLTPVLDQCGIAGIIRRLICEDTLGHGLAVTERNMHKNDVYAADELFVCNSLIGLWPVIAIDDQQSPQVFSVGPVTRRLQTLFNAYQIP